MSKPQRNVYYNYGIVVFDIGLSLLVIGGFTAMPILMGIATGILFVGVSCFMVGGINEK